MLAAVAAMDSGRRSMYATAMAGAERGPQLSAVAARRAVERFWHHLQEFEASGKQPPWAPELISASHPFLCIVVEDSGASIRVNRL